MVLNPGSSSIGAMIHAAADAGEVTRQEVELLVRSVLSAGFDTTVHGLGAAMLALGDVTIPEGAKVLMLLGAANRDPRKWPDPDRYDIDRSTAGHVGFGAGVHMCVGQLLARLEGEVLLGALARAFASLEPDGEPAPLMNNTLRGWVRMPLRATAA